MKISIDKIRTTPPNMDFSFCVFGEVSDEIKQWAAHWGFRLQPSAKFTNILVPVGYDISQCFEIPEPEEYLDGFSPNLNKHLHLGHFCNLILAKSLMSLGVAKKTVAILGDTVEGEVSKEDALYSYYNYCSEFQYKIDKVLFASEVALPVSLEDKLLVPGEGKYEGTKCFVCDEETKVVGRKKSGHTTYFYQDIALAYILENESYTVITGNEQKEHFENVKKLCPWSNHIGMGLVLNEGTKMSSRMGNVIMMQEIIDELYEEFQDIQLVYNVVAGKMLNYSPSSEKNIVKKQLLEQNSSPGLYLSYTMARLLSAGCKIDEIENFESTSLQFAFIKAFIKKDPSVLLKSLLEHAKKINSLYGKHRIQGDENNKIFFSRLLSDLSFGMKKIGMFEVDKV